MNFSGLKPYQHAHAQHVNDVLRRGGRALDASDTGTGKTFAALAQCRDFGAVPLVLAPKPTLRSWHKAADHMGVQIDALNYEKVRSKKSEYGYLRKIGKGSQWVWNHAFEFMVFDEVDRCGNDGTITSKLLIASARQCDKVLALSATAADKPQQLRALGFALRLFPLSEFKWWAFKHGCEPGVFGGIVFSDNPQERHDAMRKINKLIFPALGSRMVKTAIPGFPKTQIEAKPLDDAAGKAARLADELHTAFQRYAGEVTQDEAHNKQVRKEIRAARKEGDEALAEELKGERVSPLKILTRTRQALEILKVPDLVELALDYSRTSKVAIFVNFSETIDALRLALTKQLECFVPVFDGRLEHLPHRDDWRESFQRDEIPVLLLNSAAGGVGVDLHGPTDRTTLISPCYNSRLIEQIFGRVNREGGGFSQQFWCYFADTREAEIAATVMAKLDCLHLLNDGQLH